MSNNKKDELHSGPLYDAMSFVSDATAFLQAVERCPEVVKAESPPGMFLSFCSDNAWDAAQRMADYWTHRVGIFGQESCYKPILEALTKEDKDFIPVGGGAYLPDLYEGEMVFMFDRSRFDWVALKVSIASRLRVLWFLLQSLSLHHYNRSGRVPPCAFVARANRTGGRFQQKVVVKFTQFLREALCIRVARMHMVLLSPSCDLLSMTNTMIPAIFKRLGGWWTKLPFEIHMGSLEEIEASMQKHGYFTLPPWCSPKPNWTYEGDWAPWVGSHFYPLPTNSSVDAPKEDFTASGILLSQAKATNPSLPPPPALKDKSFNTISPLASPLELLVRAACLQKTSSAALSPNSGQDEKIKEDIQVKRRQKRARLD
jgi:hypothetical protein